MMVNIELDQKKCEGSKCSGCAYVCPTNVFAVKNDEISINSPQYCKLCYNCMEICQRSVIKVEAYNTVPAYY